LFRGSSKALTVLQWHGDTFDLPNGARLVATGKDYTNQAFRVGGVAWGLQFHIEVTTEAVNGFLDSFGSEAEAVPGGVEKIRAGAAAALAALSAPREIILDRFAQLISGGFRDNSL
jgi:GMP synthase-like glutamine amidotransferase